MNLLTDLTRRAFGAATILPLSERERRAETERTIAGVRAGAAVLYAVAAALRPGDSTAVTWSIFAVLLIAAMAGAGLSRDQTKSTPRTQIALTALDVSVFLAILTNNTSDPQDAVFLAGFLPVLEGALRWARIGGLVVGTVTGAAVAIWTVHINDLAGLPLTAEQPTFRAAALAVIGLAMGSIVASLQAQQVALQLALDSAHDPTLALDRDGAVLTANDAAVTFLDRPLEELIGRPLADALGARGEDGTAALGHSTAQEWTVEIATRPHDRRRRWIEVQIIPVADLGISYARCRDVTERRETAQRLSHQATHDPLTDLPNRRHLHAVLDKLAEAGEQAIVAFIDLDGFKSVNDDLGHDAGDQLLRQAAERMRGSVRAGDVVARLAGDEFCVVLFDADASVAEAITDRLRRVLHEPFSVAGSTVQIGASLGAVRHRPGEDSEAVVRRADRAMYEAKTAGGDRAHLDDLRSRSEPAS